MKTLTRVLVLSLAVATLLVVTGCQTVSIATTQSLGGPTYPPTNPTNVVILRVPPTQPHIRLGEIRAEPSSTSVSAAKIEEALQKAAAKLGANAAVVVYDQTQVTGAYVTGPWYGRSIQQVEGRVVIAVAIRYQ